MARKKSHFSGVPRTGNKNPTQDALTENIEVLTGQRGNELNRALLFRDLVNLDDLKRQALIASIKQSSNTNDLPIVIGGGIERPHAPVGLQGVGGFTFIALTWNKPNYKGHAYAEIFRSDTDVFSAAVKIATEVTDIFSDAVNMGSQYYYWVRFVNQANMIGPVQSANGLLVSALQSAATILAELGGKIENSHLGTFLSGEVGQIPDLAFGVDQAQLSANSALTQNSNISNDLLVSSNANDANWQTTTVSVGAIDAKINDVSASIATDYYTKVSVNGAIAIANTTLKSEIEDANGNSVGATLQNLAYTVADNNSNYTAMWGIRTNVTGITASFGLVNDGIDPIFAIKGAKFSVIDSQDPTTLTPVFSVVDGKTVVNSLLADEAHIQSLVTDSLLSNRVIVGSELKTPSINYDPLTGARSQNFSTDPNGNMVAKSATLESVTIKDAFGNIIMNSTGAISKDKVSGLGALASADNITLSSVTDAGPFAGLAKILSSNITTYIESGAIGVAQIDQAYISSLFGNNATFSGTVYAEKIVGDLVDADSFTITQTTTTKNSWGTIKILTIQKNQYFANWLTISELEYYMSSSLYTGDVFVQMLYDGQSGKVLSIPAGTGTAVITIQAKGMDDGVNSISRTILPAQSVVLQMFRQGSGFII